MKNCFIVVSMFLTVVLGGCCSCNSYESGYIDACEDFYHGKLKYDLTIKDGKNVWVKSIGTTQHE